MLKFLCIISALSPYFGAKARNGFTSSFRIMHRGNLNTKLAACRPSTRETLRPAVMIFFLDRLDSFSGQFPLYEATG
jgi:hypothetical protein